MRILGLSYADADAMVRRSISHESDVLTCPAVLRF